MRQDGSESDAGCMATGRALSHAAETLNDLPAGIGKSTLGVRHADTNSLINPGHVGRRLVQSDRGRGGAWSKTVGHSRSLKTRGSGPALFVWSTLPNGGVRCSAEAGRSWSATVRWSMRNPQSRRRAKLFRPVRNAWRRCRRVPVASDSRLKQHDSCECSPLWTRSLLEIPGCGLCNRDLGCHCALVEPRHRIIVSLVPMVLQLDGGTGETLHVDAGRAWVFAVADWLDRPVIRGAADSNSAGMSAHVPLLNNSSAQHPARA